MKRKRANAGFSLIELIVGVAIMAVIVAPLLHAFVTSAGISAKSKKLRDATLAAQNLVEVVAGNTVEDAVAGIPFAGLGSFATYHLNGTDYEAAPDSGIAGLSYLGVKNVASGASRYDAMITLDARGILANQKPIARYTPMDGVYIQPAENERNPDLLAATDFADQATILSGQDLQAADFLYAMSRTIEITVDRDEVQSMVNVSTRYRYQTDFTYLDALGVQQTVHLTAADFETSFFSNLYDAETEALRSVYFFYFPCYSSKEVIAVYNWDNVAFDLFLVKQKSALLSETMLSTKEAGYTAELRQYETGTGREAPHMTLYTNAKTNVIDQSEILQPFPYKVYKGPYRYYYGTFSDRLVATAPENRLYQVTVDLYRPGENFASAAHLLTFDASKTD